MKRKIIYGVLITTAVLLLTGCGEHELSGDEQVAWTTLRAAIAQSAYSGQSIELTTEHIETLKNMAKSNGGDWFSSLYGYAYGETKDTDDYEITILCDGDYCATFKVEARDGYRLVDYKFEESDEKGYFIDITEK